MKITEMAAKLRKSAVDLEALAAKVGDLDFSDEFALPFLVNFLTDDSICRGSRSSVPPPPGKGKRCAINTNDRP